MAKIKKSATDDAIKAQLARALADYDNLVKRQARERQEIVLRANRQILEDLLQVVDNLEKAEQHLQDAGLKMGMDNLRGLLVRYGVSEIEAQTGQEFDSLEHEATDAIVGEKPGTIADVVAKGYKWNDGQVLRPVKVIVYKGGE